MTRDANSRRPSGGRLRATFGRSARKEPNVDGATLLASLLGGQGEVYAAFDNRAWGALALEAERTGLCGLALERAQSLGLGTAESIKGRLRAGRTNVAAEELNLVQEAQRVLAALDDAGVPVLVLKGLALLATVYRRPGLRPMGDIDLLIRPDDVERATKALARAGCRRGAEFVQDDFFPRFHYETEWTTGSPRSVRIDLHVRPFRPLRVACTIPDEALWDGATRITVGDSPALIPEPARMLIHLCAHAAFHGCARLIWLYDIHRFIRHYARQLNWDTFVRLTDSWHLALAVRLAIRRCAGTFGPCVPREVDAALRGGRVSWRDRLVLWQAPHDAERPVLHVLTNTVTTPRLGLAAGYVAACLGPNRAHLEQVYPGRPRGGGAAAPTGRVLRAAARPLTGPAHLGLRSSPRAKAQTPN